MPPAAVFFYIDPLFLQDPAMDGVKSLTLSYTFFDTGDKEVMDIAHELAKREDSQGKPADGASEKIRAWTAAVAQKTGVDAGGGAAAGGAARSGGVARDAQRAAPA